LHVDYNVVKEFAETLLSNELRKSVLQSTDLLFYRSFVTSLSLELQQRSYEYVSLFDEQWATLQQQALARMPVTHVFREISVYRGGA